MDAGDLIDLDVTDVAHGGVFVGRHSGDAESAARGGRVVFVPDAIPGERVRVRLTEVGKAAFWRGEVVDVHDASPDRQPHVWRAADIDVAPEDRPGGADFGHIRLSAQRRLKLKVLQDALQRIGGIEVPVSIEPALLQLLPDGTSAQESADGTGWRTRVSLHVDDEGRIGPFAARSHRVVAVADHPLATGDIERAARELAGAKPGRVDLVQPADGRVRVIPRPDGARRRPGARPGADPARETIVERIGAREFRLDAGGFWQVHRLAASSLSTHVAALLRETRQDGPAIDPDGWHLDLYGGVGLFAATLGELAGAGTRVTSVESDPRATEHAGANLAEWVGARAETGRVDRWVAQLAATASARDRERLARGVVLLDPPRSGAGREVVRSIAELAPDVVVYVACDPVALARDLKTFAEHGYRTPRVSALDLFPNSHHFEAVAVLTRPDRRG